MELKIKKLQDSKQEERLRLEAERMEKERRLEEKYQKLVCRQEHKTVLFHNLKHFEQDFLNAYNFYQAECTEHILLSEYKAEKLNCVQSWVKQHLSYKLATYHIDKGQLTCIADNIPEPE